MNDLIKALKKYKRQNQLTNAQIAEQLGVTTPTVSRWITGGIKKIAPDTQKKICDLIGIDFETGEVSQKLVLTKPLINPAKMEDDFFAEANIEEYIPVTPDDDKRGDFFLRYMDDNMVNCHIIPGDLLYVKKSSNLSDGSYGVFLIDNEEVTVNKLFKKDDCWILSSSDMNAAPRIFTIDEIADSKVKVLGNIVYSRRDFDQEIY